MKIILTGWLICLTALCFGQTDYIKAGDRLPNVLITELQNAPLKSLNLNAYATDKVFILNFWGTWCSPCIPDMDRLAKLQVSHSKKLQVLAISDDSPERLRNYLKKKPTTVWLATDSSYFLYGLFGFASVGMSAVIGKDHRVIALVETATINESLIGKILSGEAIASTANIKKTLLNNGEDAFGVDSTTRQSFTIRGFMQGKPGMSMQPNSGPFAFRRFSFFNTCGSEIVRRACDITAQKQVIYELKQEEICNFDDEQSLYCVDLLVPLENKDSLLQILQKKLSVVMPFKFSIAYRQMPVYILKKSARTSLQMPLSVASNSSFSFSGLGFDGTAILVDDFAKNYLSNELSLPVVDETGLTGKYDIKTNNDISTEESTIKAVERLGLVLEKGERKVKVLIFSK
jgi:thiol-disulfide isomerase/thioredoxin